MSSPVAAERQFSWNQKSREGGHQTEPACKCTAQLSPPGNAGCRCSQKNVDQETEVGSYLSWVVVEQGVVAILDAAAMMQVEVARVVIVAGMGGAPGGTMVRRWEPRSPNLAVV